MITNISITTVFVKDVDESKRFYVDVLGFEEKDDITMGDYRWCTVVHPNQPELMVHLNVPGPPFAPEMVEAINRSLDGGGMNGLGSRSTTATRPSPTSRPRASSSCRTPPTARTASRPSAATTPATGWCWSRRRSSTR